MFKSIKNELLFRQKRAEMDGVVRRQFLIARSMQEAIDILKQKGYADIEQVKLPDQKDIELKCREARELVVGFLRSRKNGLERVGLHLFTNYPARALLLNGTELETMRNGFWGEHIERTNIVLVAKAVSEDTLSSLVHEQLHYLQELFEVYRPPSGYYVFGDGRVFIPWFEEGMTEFLALKVLELGGYGMIEHAYPREVRAIRSLLQMLGDEEMLISAHRAKNITTLTIELNRRLGDGVSLKIFGDPKDCYGMPIFDEQLGTVERLTKTVG